MKRMTLTIIAILAVLIFALLISSSASAYEVLIVDAVAEPGLEFQTLSANVKEAQGQEVVYTQIVTGGLADEISSKYAVVWLGWNCSSDDGAYFRDDDAEIAAYVEAGGVLVTSASDNNGWQSVWLPDEVIIADTGDYELVVTPEGETLFNSPNEANPSTPIMDERYQNIGKGWTVLAWAAGMEDSEAGAIQIGLGKGLYLLVSIDTRNAGNAQTALTLMENMLNYAIAFAAEGSAIKPAGKLPVVWGRIKE